MPRNPVLYLGFSESGTAAAQQGSRPSKAINTPAATVVLRDMPAKFEATMLMHHAVADGVGEENVDACQTRPLLICRLIVDDEAADQGEGRWTAASRCIGHS